MANEILGLVDKTTGQEVADADARYIIVPAGSVQGDLLHRTAAGWDRLPAGVANQMLKTLGAGNNPAWDSIQNVPPFDAANQGDVLYRNASSWSKLSPGSVGDFLQTQGAGANPLWAAAGGGSSTFTGLTDTSGLFTNDRILASHPGYNSIEFVDAPKARSWVVGNRDREATLYGPHNDRAIHASSNNYLHSYGSVDGLYNAVTAASTSSSGGHEGGTVFLKRGVYKTDNQIDLNYNGIEIEGEGPSNTSIEFTNAVIGSEFIRVTGGSCSLKNLSIRIPTTGRSYCIYVSGSKFKMENVFINFIGIFTGNSVTYVHGPDSVFNRISVNNSIQRIFNVTSSGSNLQITKSSFLAYAGINSCILMDSVVKAFILYNEIEARNKPGSSQYGLIHTTSTNGPSTDIFIVKNKISGVERIIYIEVTNYAASNVYIHLNIINHYDYPDPYNEIILLTGYPVSPYTYLTEIEISSNNIMCDTDSFYGSSTVAIWTKDFTQRCKITDNLIYLANRSGLAIRAEGMFSNVNHNKLYSWGTDSVVDGIQVGSTSRYTYYMSCGDNQIYIESKEATGIYFTKVKRNGCLSNNVVDLRSADDPCGIHLDYCDNVVVNGNNVRALGTASLASADAYLFDSPCNEISITSNFAKISTGGTGFRDTAGTMTGYAMGNGCDNSTGGTKDGLSFIRKTTAGPDSYPLNFI